MAADRNSADHPVADSPVDGQSNQGTTVLYREVQRVPLFWWLCSAGVVALIAWQAQMGRDWWWAVIAGVIAGVLTLWGLISLSRTSLTVVRRADGSRWLHAGDATLPAEVVSRTLVIPPTAKQAAMGRQLDPAAFVIHKWWIPTMAMLVLDDPNDPTPYWLLSSKEPAELLEALDRPIF